jgi:membrane protease YdiL (CAAX protease family)
MFLISRGTSIPTAVVVSLCGGLILGGMLILGIRDCLEELQKWLIAKPGRVVAVIAALWGVYIISSVGTNTAEFRSFVVLAVYLSVPFLLLSSERGLAHGTWLDAVTILWIWIPIESGILRRIILTSALNAEFQYGLTRGLAIIMGIIAFAAWRNLPGIGYQFEFDRKKVSLALLSFLLFAVIAIPLGLAIHFIQYTFELWQLAFAPLAFLGIFLSIGIPEEFLFRGLIQNWFERVTDRRNLSLLLASIVFGAAHLNNGLPIPNYKYFLMASIAGIFYGLVWQRTGNIAASAITHALVDTAWNVFFR